jgi:hypothetical protein
MIGNSIKTFNWGLATALLSSLLFWAAVAWAITSTLH